MKINAIVPVKAVNELNVREHWSARAARAKKHRRDTYSVLGPTSPRPQPPCTVTLTRIGVLLMDDDGNSAALKHVRDGVADWLGIDDGDPRLKFVTDQRKTSRRGHFGVEVQIEGAP